MDSHLIAMLSIPLFTGAIGYVTNASGVWMLFYPVHFAGFHPPGLKGLAQLLPRKIQQIPGVAHGGVGWQGIIPSRAAKMGSIAVDKGIAKMGSPNEFYKHLDSEALAEHILESMRDDIRDLVERILQREHPQLWRDTPPAIRQRVHQRVQDQLPEITREVIDVIGNNIEHLMDVKLMVIKKIEEQPALANRIFLDVGKKELRFIVNFGFFFGLIQGIPLVFITEALPYWYILPIGGVIIGYVTNWVALWMIFEPAEPRKFGPFKVQGLFIRRQPEVAGVYSKIIAEDIVTLEHMGDELLTGPQSDRTKRMIERSLGPAIENSLGRARSFIRVAMGAGRFDAIRDSVATESIRATMVPMSDPKLSETQGARLQELFQERMSELPPDDFAEMLRSAMKQDEWLLLLHGAVLGFGAGLVHLAIFGV